jgi:hypothetical protein
LSAVMVPRFDSIETEEVTQNGDVSIGQSSADHPISLDMH